MKSFSNKVAAVTGAGSGIGRALALNLAQQGCHLAIADVNAKGLEETRDLLAQYPVNVTTEILAFLRLQLHRLGKNPLVGGWQHPHQQIKKLRIRAN